MRKIPRWNAPEVRDASSLIDGIRLHWIAIGNSSALPPIVMLHGLNDSSQTWRRIASELARDRLVLLPDLPGHGRSERPDASYKLAWYAHVMSIWLQHLGHLEVDLIGHSFGGGVAQMMLLECRALIRRLVLVSSGGLGREISMALRLASIPRVVERFGQPFMAVGTQLALRLARDGRTREDIAALSALNAQKGSARAFARTVRDIIDWRGQRHTYHQRIHEISELPPMLVLWGSHDAIIPATHGKDIAAAFEGVQLIVFEHCGHYLHYDKPDLFVRTLLGFLQIQHLPPPRARAGTNPT
ncbi:MAG: alpha/beta hydrolase [Proteobacteria bacterium]|nr:alpha/beta hydrolase [Pseudomonadota bacterium]